MLAPATIGVEVLDSPGADPALVRRMLTDIARANRWLGGVTALEVGLRYLLGTTPRPAPLTLLDVGTGAGDLPLAARAWGARHGIHIRSVGVERHPAAAHLSRENGVPCAVACGSALPFKTPIHHSPPPLLRGAGQAFTNGVDIVLISQLLHHFDDTAALTLIREAASVARCGVILTDLRPMPGAALGFRLAGRVLGFHRTTVHDGIVSMSRGRSAQALGQLAARAGARHPLVRNLATARVVVAFRTDS